VCARERDGETADGRSGERERSTDGTVDEHDEGRGGREEEIADVGEAATAALVGLHRQGRGTSEGPASGRRGGREGRGGCLATGLPAAGQSSVIK